MNSSFIDGKNEVSLNFQKKRQSIKSLLRLFAASTGSILLPSCSTTSFSKEQLGSEYIIKNGYLLTMDPALGELPRGDVHVKDGQILGVDKLIQIPGMAHLDASNMVVMPGFVDTHWHIWNTIQKNMLSKGVEYFPLKAALVQHYTVEDFYNSNRLAYAEAINAGITTVHNFSHNTRSSKHVDAELKAFLESGLRGRYSYGWTDPIPDNQVMNLVDIERVQREWFSKNSPFGGLLQLGMALRGPMYTPKSVYSAEFEMARKLKLPTILHVGQTKRRFAKIADIYKEGFLDSSTILVHGVVATEEDRKAIVASGATISFSPQSELRDQEDGDFREQLLQMMASKINISLSIDSSVLGAASMFDQMAAVWYMGIPWRGTPSEKLPYVDFEDVLKMATINGAKAMGLTDKVGSITPGKRADIIMIRTDDLNVTPIGHVKTAMVRSAQTQNVDTVIVDGVLKKRAGRLLGVDLTQIKANAEKSLFDVRMRAGSKWAPN